MNTKVNYIKRFENERSYLFPINNTYKKNFYITTYTNDYKDYSQNILTFTDQKETCNRLSQLNERMKEHRNKIIYHKN